MNVLKNKLKKNDKSGELVNLFSIIAVNEFRF